MHPSQEDVALSEAPTAVLSKPASAELSARHAARAAEDPEQTLPLSRTVSGGLMGTGGGSACQPSHRTLLLRSSLLHCMCLQTWLSEMSREA